MSKRTAVQRLKSVELLAAVILYHYREGRHDMARERLGGEPVGLISLPDDEALLAVVNGVDLDGEPDGDETMRMRASVLARDLIEVLGQ
jgi:hypothetical protein